MHLKMFFAEWGLVGLWVEAIDKLANASLIAYHLLKEAIYCHGSAKGQDFSQTHGTRVVLLLREGERVGE